jgi:hypothetical protein
MNDEPPKTPEEVEQQGQLTEELRAAAEDEAAGRVIDFEEFDRRIRATRGWSK